MGDILDYLIPEHVIFYQYQVQTLLRVRYKEDNKCSKPP